MIPMINLILYIELYLVFDNYTHGEHIIAILTQKNRYFLKYNNFIIDNSQSCQSTVN